MNPRLTALAAAAVAAVAAAPAAAYEAPVRTCATYVLHSDAGAPVASCRAWGAPRISGLDTYRVWNVQVAAGVVEARVTCKNQWWYDTDSAWFYPSTQNQTLRVIEDEGMTCTHELIARADNTTATGESSFTYMYPYGAAR